jgi:hypothetical protein
MNSGPFAAGLPNKLPPKLAAVASEMGQHETSRSLSHAGEIAVAFNRELPMGRADVL